MAHGSVLEFRNPDPKFHDHLTEIIRSGCQQIIEEALETELRVFLEYYQDAKDAHGRQRIVRNGHLPERHIQTGIGPVAVKVPRTRDRAPDGGIQFRSSIVPTYLRKTRSIEELLPWLYLKGISTGDFSEALSAILGTDAPGLSSNTICRLKSKWQAELDQWHKRDLSQKRYVYWWADGIYCKVRMDEKQCLLVVIGVTDDGKKELVAIEGGFRESELSWKALLGSLKQQGLSRAPKLAIGDGALGFWKALN
ncbi:MAG: IS256 family transposase, partial [Deltaproteobacteria bacterium]|nr:IS256 family transposase [Deltaproteobacteria bacterium]